MKSGKVSEISSEDSTTNFIIVFTVSLVRLLASNFLLCLYGVVYKTVKYSFMHV